MRRIFLGFVTIFLGIFVLAACGQGGQAVEARAIFEVDRMYLDGQLATVAGTDFAGATLTFVGEEAGGNVIIRIGGGEVQATINPSREHPSFADGVWHHHLYAASSVAGSPRINFMRAFPSLNIDDNGADDNSQSAYQRGNLHYITATGEFRLRFTINGVITDLIFVEN